MRDLIIPKQAETYIDDIETRAFPDANLRGHDFYRRLIGWVIDNRTPLLYEQDHDDEYTNFSINFNWLLLRDYRSTALGPPKTISTMYALHEFTHMTHDLPVELGKVSADEYAEAFTRSEYRASNETEILIHYRVPELRQFVFNGMKIAFDMLFDHGIPQLPANVLAGLRAVVVETDALESFFQGSQEDREIYNRFKQFNGNRQWAKQRYNAVRPFFEDIHEDNPTGLGDDNYEQFIESYEPRLTQASYEANVIRNVKFGYAMCGLAAPRIQDFEHALTAVSELEGHHAIVQS